ncbi:MerR family DNA-binding protein [Bacteriovorax sp. DB6_IX]|uniref:MerR family DNA-binding protein n=1 Tax=Bacteriovorax sp. DB6_IX TaxID=1353530 RepID=UPI00038A2373|nr:MerR family DNA-binding protein [Bacteriovorax sp. DB6_IX]EQC51581.1 putative Hg(II)-responsive transcriptional regulator [Bacteriovorax sp. DB6_IX]
MKERFTIGKLANASDVNVETIRFYERKGILEQPNKEGSFRYYPESYILKIRFIKRSQELGFSLKEAKELLDLRIKNHAKCSDVLSKTEKKINEIDKKIADLKKMKASLKNLANCCVDETQPLSECPILECFIDGV